MTAQKQTVSPVQTTPEPPSPGSPADWLHGAQQLVGNSGVLDWLLSDEASARPAATATTTSSDAPPVPGGSAFSDGGGFVWLFNGADEFVCVGTPEGKEDALWRTVTPDSDADTYATLWELYVQANEELLELVQDGEPQSTLDWLLEAGSELVDGMKDGAEQLWDWVWEDDSPDACPDTSAPTPESERKQRHDADLEEGKTDVLDEAIRLARDNDQGHKYDVGRSNNTKSHVWDDNLLQGDISGLDSLVCSEFVAASIAASGYELEQPYVDPATGLRVAYDDGGTPTFVELWMVAGMFEKATHAVIITNAGAATRIEAGSDEAIELGCDDETFLYAEDAASFVGLDADANHLVGAPAAVVQLGGGQVDLDERKPGDVQQRLDVKAGSYPGSGHASIVHAIKGTGVAHLGLGSGSPQIEGADTKGLSGWYRVEDAKMVVGPDTEPSAVGEIAVSDVQLIDANRAYADRAYGEDRGSDATEVGGFDEVKEPKEPGKLEDVTGAARLPSSPWFAWSSAEGDDVRELPREASPEPAKVEQL